MKKNITCSREFSGLLTRGSNDMGDYFMRDTGRVVIRISNPRNMSLKSFLKEISSSLIHKKPT